MAKKLTLLDFQLTAKNNGGFCLSQEYINLDQIMTWQCHLGHIFNSRAEDVRRGSWCRQCSDIKNSSLRKNKFFLKVKSLVESKEGKLKSTNYIDKNSKLDIECKFKHNWQARSHDLFRGHWCPTCAGNTKLTIEDMKAVAFSRKGLCLSDIYINSQTKLIWQCKYGHVWNARPAEINYGTWCPYCKNKSEEICRSILENIFEEKFIKCRPKWLVGINNFSLELDGYCEKFNIAFEYNGRQHYEYIKFFNNKDKLDTIMKNDKKKIELCEKYGVKLLVIKWQKNPTEHSLKEAILKLL